MCVGGRLFPIVASEEGEFSFYVVEAGGCAVTLDRVGGSQVQRV